MNEEETKIFLISEYRKIFCKFAENKIQIPEDLIKEIESGAISNTAGKAVFEEILVSGKDVKTIIPVETRKLTSVSCVLVPVSIIVPVLLFAIGVAKLF